METRSPAHGRGSPGHGLTSSPLATTSRLHVSVSPLQLAGDREKLRGSKTQATISAARWMAMENNQPQQVYRARLPAKTGHKLPVLPPNGSPHADPFDFPGKLVAHGDLSDFSLPAEVVAGNVLMQILHHRQDADAAVAESRAATEQQVGDNPSLPIIDSAGRRRNSTHWLYSQDRLKRLVHLVPEMAPLLPTANAKILPFHHLNIDHPVLPSSNRSPLVASSMAAPSKFYRQGESPIFSSLGAAGQSDDARHEAKMGVRFWKRDMYPSTKPATREEVIHLTAVCDLMLREIYAEDGTKPSTPPPPPPAPTAPEGSPPQPAAPSPEQAPAVGFDAQILAEISVWNAIMFELVRQVFVHCEERGALLERIRLRIMEILSVADDFCRQQSEARLAAEKLWKSMQEPVARIEEWVKVVEAYDKRASEQRNALIADNRRVLYDYSQLQLAYQMREVEIAALQHKLGRHEVLHRGVGESLGGTPFGTKPGLDVGLQTIDMDAKRRAKRKQQKQEQPVVAAAPVATAAPDLSPQTRRLVGGIAGHAISTNSTSPAQADKQTPRKPAVVVPGPEPDTVDVSTQSDGLNLASKLEETSTVQHSAQEATTMQQGAQETSSVQQDTIGQDGCTCKCTCGRALHLPVGSATTEMNAITIGRQVTADLSNEQAEGDADEEHPAPAGWKVPVPLQMAIRGTRGRLMPLKQFSLTVLQMLQDKLKSDTVDIKSGSPIEPLADFVAATMFVKFGAKKLVQQRVASLLRTARRLYHQNRLARLCARFCGLINPLPDSLVTAIIQSLDHAFNQGFATLSFATAVSSDGASLSIPKGKAAVEALRWLAHSVPNCNAAGAERKLWERTAVTLSSTTLLLTRAASMKIPTVKDKPRPLVHAKTGFTSQRKLGSFTDRKLQDAAATHLQGVVRGFLARTGSKSRGTFRSSNESAAVKATVMDVALHLSSTRRHHQMLVQVRQACQGLTSAQELASATIPAMKSLLEADGEVISDAAAKAAHAAAMRAASDGLSCFMDHDTCVDLAVDAAYKVLSKSFTATEITAATKVQAVWRMYKARTRMDSTEAGAAAFLTGQVDIVDYLEVSTEMVATARLASHRDLEELFDACNNADGAVSFTAFQAAIDKLLDKWFANQGRKLSESLTAKLYGQLLDCIEDTTGGRAHFAYIMEEHVDRIIVCRAW